MARSTLNGRPRVDLVFVLDTTGSMGGLIQTAKDKIWSIATTMARAQPAPEIRIGLVAYRDRGDQYVTQVFDLTTDLDSMYAHLMDFKADGGGDGPEAVNQALQDAIARMSWNTQQDTYKAVFLVGDAPPHLDYQDDVQYPASVALARQRGIVINTIQCGNRQDDTVQPWRQIAALGAGDFLKVEQNGGAVALSTPSTTNSRACRPGSMKRASTMAMKRCRPTSAPSSLPPASSKRRPRRR